MMLRGSVFGWFSTLTVVAGLGFIYSDVDDRTAQAPTEQAPRLRRPAALAPSKDGKWLYVANHRSGSISVIDVTLQRVVAEVEVGKSLADIVASPDSRHLLVVDESANELIRLSCRGPELSVVDRLAVAPTPVTVRVVAGGMQCSVASLWSRRLSVVSLREKLEVEQAMDVPFSPRRQLPSADGKKLIVADSFAGKLALINIERGTIESVRDLPAHNIRGLAFTRTGSDLLLTHQTLAALAQTTRDDIHWGNLITNNVRVIPLDDVFTLTADLLKNSRLLPLGEVGRGAGDPAGIASVETDMIVALAGVDEVAIGRDGRWKRLAVGARPSAVAVSPDGSLAFVANSHDDSISFVDWKNAKVITTVSLGKQPQLSQRDRGEMLFHDARLSHDAWLSCHSCHTDGHSNGQLNDNLGDGAFGAPKRVLSLLGVKDTRPWAWNGEVADLDAQVRKSIHTTMHGRKMSEEQENAQVEALTAFLHSLTLPQAVSSDKAATERGRQVFSHHGCAACHAAPTYTTPKVYDVGLPDEVGHTRFNPPSLRGVSLAGPYFHDNRAATLADVFTTHRHQLKHNLRPDEVSDLIVFLRSL